jgi:gamma-glutamyl:cysteine ligase YbdK (ATP-grasp superfamily)
VAVVHALAAYLADLHDAGERVVAAPDWRIEENRWNALSGGVHGDFADLSTGEVQQGGDRLHALLDELEPVASRLGGGRQLAHARRLIGASGADRQRAAGGPREAVEWLGAAYLES